ncbi:polysaccharide pyruvyl transferase family protein [Leifsonia sp. YIM 134122]|uniref:Polysaccharide pyruvyl transferase family protein n=1 Tax=Leifsonia stereocauli TaxID=3134136 RepID=A0ABU9W7M3_9MICO
MRVLVLWADDLSPNLGVRVLAEGNAALVRRVWPDAQFTFQNSGRPLSELPVGRFRSLLRERVTGEKGMMRWLRSFDLVIDTRSGDSFADIYGWRRHGMMSAVLHTAAAAGVPVVLGPQTIGPFTTLLGRRLGVRSLRQASLVMARDSASAEYARSLGEHVDVVTTDVVFALPVPEIERTRDVVLNISGLLWRENPHVDSASYRAIVTELYAALRADDRRVTLLAHVLDSSSADNDVPAVREFSETIAPDAEVVVPADLDDVRRVVASAQLVIGSRMHACLNALSVGTPAIALAYSRKFAPLLADLGWAHTVGLDRPDSAVAGVLAAAASPTLLHDAADVRERAQTLLVPAVVALESLGAVTTARDGGGA